MVLKWSRKVLNEGVAPNISAFVEANIPDLTPLFPQAPHWLSNHFLNSIFIMKYPPGIHQKVVALLRRTDHAFSSYHNARTSTLEYLEKNTPLSPSLRQYYFTLQLWENFVLQISMGLSLYKDLNQGNGVFRKNDKSPEDRIYQVANQIKHPENYFIKDEFITGNILPLWLSNNGLQSFDVTLSYREAANILSSLATLADTMQHPRKLLNQ